MLRKPEIDEERDLFESVFDDDDDGTIPSGQLFSLRTGGSRDVTLTLPDGRRTTFTYSLVPSQCNSGDEVDFCATPMWTAPPGVNAQLRAITDNKLVYLLS